MEQGWLNFTCIRMGGLVRNSHSWALGRGSQAEGLSGF